MRNYVVKTKFDISADNIKRTINHFKEAMKHDIFLLEIFDNDPYFYVERYADGFIIYKPDEPEDMLIPYIFNNLAVAIVLSTADLWNFSERQELMINQSTKEIYLYRNEPLLKEDRLRNFTKISFEFPSDYFEYISKWGYEE